MSYLYNVPNVISLARLLMAPFAVGLILEGMYTAAFWLFLAAGLSDAVDGFIAKIFNAQSRVGAYLDPLADKALLVSVYVTLGFQYLLPDWLVILVVSRDLLIIGGALFNYTVTNVNLSMAPLQVSKLNTLAQIVLAAVILAHAADFIDAGGVIEILIYVVAATTFVSGGGYLARWLRVEVKQS